MDDMDQNRRQSSDGSRSSIDSGAQKSLNQTTASSESISDLNKKLESSLSISKKPESKSEDEQPKEQCNLSLSSDFKKSESEILYRKPSLKESESSSRSVQTPKSTKIVNDKPPSPSNRAENPKKDTIIQRSPTNSRAEQEVDVLPSTKYSSSIDPKLYPPRYNYMENPAFPSQSVSPVKNQACADPEQYPEQSSIDPKTSFRQDIDRLSHQHKTTNSALVQNNTLRNQIALPNRHEVKSQQWQVPTTNIMTVARILVQSRSSTRTSYHNPMPPIRTNASPMRYAQSSSSYYINPMPHIKTNAIPIRYVKRSLRYQDKKFSVRINATSRHQIQPARDTSSNTAGRMNYSPDAAQSRLQLTPGQVLKSPAKQSKESTSKEIENASDPKLEKSKNEIRLEELAKKSHYSKKNRLKIDIPTKELPTSYFPLNTNPQGGLLLRQIQRTPIQFTTPSGSDYFGSNFRAWSRIPPNMPCQTVRPCTQPRFNSYFHPVALNQAVSRPVIQNNMLMDSLSNSDNSIQPPIQSQIVTSQTGQYQQASQNLTAAQQYLDPINPIYQYDTEYKSTLPNIAAGSQYQNPNSSQCQYLTQYRSLMQKQYAESQHHFPNHLMYQYETHYQPTMQNQTSNFQYQDPNHFVYQPGTHYQPTMQNQTSYFQYQDPNHFVYQPGTHYQPTMQNQTSNFQYQDPNQLLYQYGTHYQTAMQNLTSNFQYHDPNHAIYQYGANTSSGTFCPPDMLWSYPTYGGNIPSQQLYSNIFPIQTFTTNPSSTGMIQNPTWPYGSRDQNYYFTDDPNLLPSISDVQTTEENPSSICASQYPTDSYVTNASTNQACLDDPNQGSNNNQEYVSMNNPDQMQTNMYIPWSVSTGDSPESTPIYKRDENSENQ
ncbi:unnamed protein product [Larinioides sclopetarius]|uniref:Enamelin n=1 Tax=Larinioides sclopetarius TaxID=280406 RepID=A0AAV1ZL86_9ARAC